MDLRGPLWVLLALLLVAPASAQDAGAEAGPDVVLLVHHPFPDDADPLGVPFGPDCDRACDAFVERHGAKRPFDDGIAFPGFIADGRIAMESLVTGDDTFQATLDAYEAAVQDRLAQETPITLRVQTRVVDGELRAVAWTQTSTSLGDGLLLWAALVEDPVHFEPPPALSNGVFEHPFTLRHIEALGSIAPSPEQEQRTDIVIPLDEAWEAERIRLAVWVEQDRTSLGTFDAGEVVQAVSHAILDTEPTVRSERAVLVEAYSASWCDPCLIGDEALEELAAAHGLPTGRDLASESVSYLRGPGISAGLWAVLAAGGFALFALIRLEAP